MMDHVNVLSMIVRGNLLMKNVCEVETLFNEVELEARVLMQVVNTCLFLYTYFHVP